MMRLLNSNFFIGAATIATGFAIILVFYLQKQDEKINAARVIVAEIIRAEKAIHEIRDTKAVREISILPINSWSKFSYLFVGDLDRDEIDSISIFYGSAESVERNVRRINSSLPSQLENKANKIQDKLLEMASQFDEVNYGRKKAEFLKIAEKEEYWFLPNQPQNQLIDVVDKFNFVSGNSGMIKLKAIAGFY